MSASKTLERISARVFCHAGSKGGGNPVTVFSSAVPLSSDLQGTLAKSCEWESVMVSIPSSSDVADMAFYMPSGEQVSFCAHAALGGAWAVAKQNIDVRFRSQLWSESEHTVRISPTTSSSEQNDAGMACLSMSAKYDQFPVSHPPTLMRLLRGHCGLGSEQLVARGKQFPSFINASVARPKTLVYVNSMDVLHQATQPKVSEDPHQRNSFAAACGAVDDSTGIYLYTTKPDETGAWECRQFPRASGYPEDPATGIAAAALAVSLYRDGIFVPIYKFYQGTAMQRPSLIEVLDLRLQEDGHVTFSLQGRVEIDRRETITI
jgi:predicted PhzF superfamily epimerase YddE/YHI9